MVPSQALGALLSLRAARQRVAELESQCMREQAEYRARHCGYLPLGTCPSYQRLQQAQEASRRLRRQFGV